jgi:digeranylgeranylglycerophospholipid reductase
MQWDIAIVGAGPSGASTAKFAAEKGLKVLVVERKKEIGFPSPCAGYVSKLVSRYFKIDRKCIQQEIERMRTFFPSGKVHVAEMQGWIVNRSLFDKLLAIQAAQAGAKFSVDSEAVDLIKDAEVRGIVFKKHSKTHKVEAKVIVGADGVLSRVAKWSGLPTLNKQDIAICPQYEMVNVKLDNPSFAETYFTVDYAPGAYVWIYPTGKDSAKVGLGIKKFLANASPFEYLNRFINEHPIASEKFKDATVISSIVGLVPIGGVIEKTYTNNLLLVGDAAGMADPISGAGIISGILAGKIAAKVAHEAIEDRDTSEERLVEYEKRWKKLLGKRFERSLRKRKIVDKAYSSNDALEKVIAETWITSKEFWKN